MNVQKNNGGSVIQGAIILTIAGLLIKILSAAYRVPYQNIVGDIGFYIYQQIYPFYGMSVILATSGFPVIISKVMLDHGYERSHKIRSKIMTVSLLYLLAVGLLLFLPLFEFSSVISGYMGDSQLSPLIKVTAFSFLMIPFISIIRGYFQSEQNMNPTALSQVIEQGIRVTLILVSSFLMLRMGFDLYEIGIGALLSSIIGSVVAFVFLILYSQRKRADYMIKWNLSAPIKTMDILESLAKYSVTIGISSLLLIFIQLIDALNLYSLLIHNGMDETLAKQTKGIYDRGQPLIQLGTVVATSLALSLVPVLAQAKMKKNRQFIQEQIELSLKLCIVIAGGAAIGLMAIMKPINIMLFTNSYGTNVLIVLSFSVLFTSLALTQFAILQGLGYTFFPVVSVLIGVGIKYIANQWLVPEFNVIGAAFSTVISYGIVVFLTYIYMLRKSYHFQSVKMLMKVTFALLIMFLSLSALLHIVEGYMSLENRLFASLVALVGVVIGGGIYGLMILKLRIFTDRELLNIPIMNKEIKLK
ncbi:PST family polysaccharide transporter [Metabacillus crassostreae]|uniref:putative polysaccharide biosynthesis protein n=1 Tax=Metabacillus crassostreae TaxID=929098 RepID=UPI001956910D|nr:polysaccharide biosynthesis protein [Metabacillus crassostreae]MBM7606563.1 PST family polysaccharide transporter [Metabacillus crassostreae]